MRKQFVTVMLVAALAMSTLAGCGSSNEANAELQAQLEAMQAELDALKQEAEAASEEVAEESTEEVEESAEEVVEESTEEAAEESTEEVAEESTEEAVEESTEEATAVNTEVSADWTTYSFSVNGKTLTLPCTYQELADATGFAMKSSDAKSYLEGGYYTYVNLYTPDEDLALYIDILNDTEEDQTYADCKVVSVKQTEYQAIEKGASIITFAGGMQVGMEMTTADVEAIFGEPQDTYEYISDDSDYESYTWTYAADPDWSSHDNFEVTIVNGIVDEICIDHLYYE